MVAFDYITNDFLLLYVYSFTETISKGGATGGSIQNISRCTQDFSVSIPLYSQNSFVQLLCSNEFLKKIPIPIELSVDNP
ncbi:hypothetical protein PDR31_28615 [Bacillus cereus]|nr:hypothetical protein [Bacillus cereus]